MRSDIKKKVIRRLKIVEGQIRGLQRMTEEEEYCVNIIQQTLAVKEALSGLENLILENHLSTHVISQIKDGQEEKTIAEILKIYKLSKRK